jgi:DMSO/TMAO reductase YedYZ molybdopterin-dependent catalytic subunit
MKKNNDTFQSEESIRKNTMRSFLLFTAYFIAVITGIALLRSSQENDGMLKPLRKVADFNAGVFNRFFSHNHRAKQFNLADAVKDVRVNGDAGMGNEFKVADWKLKLVPFGAKKDTVFLSMEDLKKLPKTEIIFDFKCIEGWSQVTHWGGVRLSDFLKKYPVAGRKYFPLSSPDNSDLAEYVGMHTPDNNYYVGIDMASAMHPQTILCYEMNGKPLPYNQGAPLRLIIPVKYGIKSIKRIGTIFFSDSRPPDYWAEKGYDYYSGL